MTVWTIRRISNKKVYYLYSYDLENNTAVWVSEYMKAHSFDSQPVAEEFITTYLRDRAQECDVFGQDEMWMI